MILVVRKLSILILTLSLISGCHPESQAAAPKAAPATPTPAGLYDDFNNQTFDGSFNTNLCKYDNSVDLEAYQEKGALVIATYKDSPPKKDEDHVFVPASPESWNFSDFHSMEVKMKLGSERKAHNGMIKSQLILPHWKKLSFIECQMLNTFDEIWFFCNYANDRFWTNGYAYEYKTPYLKLAYDQWYTVRFEINPSTAAIRYYLDNQLIGEHTPDDADAAKASEVIVHLGTVTNRGDFFIGYFDDAKFNN